MMSHAAIHSLSRACGMYPRYIQASIFTHATDTLLQPLRMLLLVNVASYIIMTILGITLTGPHIFIRQHLYKHYST